jgi:hypothetical protein
MVVRIPRGSLPSEKSQKTAAPYLAAGDLCQEGAPVPLADQAIDLHNEILWQDDVCSTG